nr:MULTISPECIES: ABC-three component system protein [Pseudomonas]
MHVTIIQETTAIQHAQRSAVKVNNGSGVLVSALSDKIAYVLTARHVVPQKKATVEDYEGNRLKVIDCINYPRRGVNRDIDCAIVIVEASSDLNYARLASSKIEDGSSCWMIGYPESRREKQDNASRLKVQDGNIAFAESHTFVMNATNSPSKTFLNGFSGSGVFVQSGGICELVGIETRVDEDPIEYEEHLGRVRCYRNNHYVELAAFYSLPRLAPDYLTCFSRLKDLIFELDFVDEANIEGILTLLFEAADKLIANGLPKPFELIESYGQSLLIPNSDPNYLVNKNLWVSLLEFYIICGLIDHTPMIDSNYLKTLERTRRFLYEGSDTAWLKKLQEILYFAKDNLDANSVIVIGSPETNPRLTPNNIQLESIITNISSPDIFSSEMRIDTTTTSHLRSLVIHHLKAIHGACMLDNEFVYKDKSKSDLLTLFRGQYGQFIKR